MRVVVSGATGFIGRRLCEALSERGDEVVALTRRTDSPAALALAGIPRVTTAQWSTGPEPALDAVVQGADAVVNLAGEPVAGRRWTRTVRERILASRVNATSALVDSMKHSSSARVLVNASGVGFYGSRGDEVLTESSPPGDDFLAQVCHAWESAALQGAPELRVVPLRIGIVLGEHGGALEKMILPFRLFAGGPIGSGRHWMSWIHRDDLIALILFALDREVLDGPVNAVSPEPCLQRDFAKALGRALGRPSWLPVPPLALKAAFGESAEVLTASQRALPTAATDAGFRFRYTDLDEALRSVLR